MQKILNFTPAWVKAVYGMSVNQNSVIKSSLRNVKKLPQPFHLILFLVFLLDHSFSCFDPATKRKKCIKGRYQGTLVAELQTVLGHWTKSN